MTLKEGCFGDINQHKTMKGSAIPGYEHIKIQYGLDPQGFIVHIKEAKKIPHYYRCVKCRWPLQARKGDVYRWYFAHTKEEEGCPECLLRTDPHAIKDWEIEIRTTEEENAEKERKLQLTILIHPYTNTVSLHGVMPTINENDVQLLKKTEEKIDAIQMKVIRGASHVSSERFGISEGEVMIPLDPGSPDYHVSIESIMSGISILGGWKSDGLRIGDIFVGDGVRAKLNRGKSFAKEGETLYVVLDGQSRITPKNGEIQKLGKFNVLKLEYNNNSINEFSDLLEGKIKKDDLGFQVDVIIPTNVNPNGIGPVFGPPGSKIVLAIIPHEKSDPEFEVLSVPYIEDETHLLPSIGEGKPRLFPTQFPELGSKQISVFCHGKHRVLKFVSKECAEKKEIDEPIVGVAVKRRGEEWETIRPWECDDSSPIRLHSQVGFSLKTEYGDVSLREVLKEFLSNTTNPEANGKGE